ncbi:hypothetical protein HPP92_011717 [Vanilla planifolia]|uniref:PWWP domain-containing protein n=1 Tax=Vanilla planifolia TaxID=51239 RepID=A0A835RC03_VANPL|nr:hypothetical protein HPP92_011717 [Vanilla planifolia]
MECGREGEVLVSVDVELEKGFDQDKMQTEEVLPLDEFKSVFSVGDLVWGKVRSHPWWPGLIFHPSFASELAFKHHKHGHFLVAYFGDKTFAWNDESRLKAFESCFSQMAKQSSMDAFLNAVDDALQEVEKRIEIGLSCGCITNEYIAVLKSHQVENAGIREGTCYPIVDSCIALNSFEPNGLLQYVQALALLPYGGFDKLELVQAKAQLKSFYKLRGYPELPEFCVGMGLLDNEEDTLVSRSEEAGEGNVEYKSEGIPFGDASLKEKKRGRGRPSGKRKPVESDSRKQKRLPELTKENGNSSLKGKLYAKSSPNSSDIKQRVDKEDSMEYGKGKKKRLDSLGDVVSMSPSPSRARAVKLGQRISQIASQLKRAEPIMECNGKKVPGVEANLNERTGIVDATGMPNYPSPSDMLSELCLVAQDPTSADGFQSVIFNFLYHWRDSVMSNFPEDETLVNLVGSRRVRKRKTDPDFLHDSYWSDVIFQESPNKEATSRGRKRKPKSKAKKQKKKNKVLGRQPSFSSNASEQVSDDSTIAHEKQPEEGPDNLADDKMLEECNPASLILNFSDADALPSESDLIKVFSHYGPLKEAATEVSRKSRRASVVFRRGADAEIAFSSAGKFSAFGPALVSYRLRYTSLSPRRSPAATPEKNVLPTFPGVTPAKDASPTVGATPDFSDSAPGHLEVEAADGQG